jgi:hypothetical protein
MNTDANASSSPHKTMRRWLRFSLAGLLFIVLCWAGVLAGVRIGAQRYVLNPDPLRLTVPQRSSRAIPGLHGKAVVQLDDITHGQVSLSIYDEAKTPLLARVSAQNADVLPFTVNGQQFYVYVAKLHNALVGEDFGELEISTTDRWTNKQ